MTNSAPEHSSVEHSSVEHSPEPDSRVTIAYLLGSLDVGGAERHVAHLLEGLDRARFRPILFLTRKKGAFLPRIESLGIPVRESGVLSVFTWAGFRGIVRLAATLRRENVRIVHSYLYGANLIGAGLCFLEPTLFHLVAIRRNQLPHTMVFRPLFRWLEGPRTRFVSVSRAADAVLGSWGISPRWRYQVPNGVEIPPLLPEPRRREIRAGLGLPPEAVLVSMVANFDPDKGHRDLLRAFALLGSEGPAGKDDPWLCLIGDGELLEECRELARALRIENRVLFLGRRGDVQDLLQASDLFVLNSRTEGMSNALLEAIAAGLPAVATDVGGNPEVIEDGHNGLLVPAGDPAAQAGAIRLLLANPELRASLGTASRARAIGLFSLEAMIRRIEAIYDEMVRDGAGSLE